jgi:hypothetical protein
MPLSPAAARWLTGQGHDAVHANDLELQRTSDAVIIARPQQEAEQSSRPISITRGSWPPRRRQSRA